MSLTDNWSLRASHECLEMLADPFGDRMIPGPSIERGEGRVSYLVEVCDPPESEEFAYTVNDVLASDFITPSFYDPVTVPGVRYSFTGAVKRPRQVLEAAALLADKRRLQAKACCSIRAYARILPARRVRCFHVLKWGRCLGWGRRLRSLVCLVLRGGSSG